MEEKSLAPTEKSPLVWNEHSPRSLFDREPSDMVAYASTVANTLKSVIDKQGLSVKLGMGIHIKAEGWSTLGSMLGIVPREVEIKQYEDGTYEAVVELYNISNDRIVGRGSAICSPDERNWKGKDRFARRSMAITRATSKAYRQGLGWIVTLAGYEPCPFEEMEATIVEVPPKVIFDMLDPKHVTRLRTFLKTLNVESGEQCERIEMILNGKEFSEEKIREVISQVVKTGENLENG